jgi:hypothetical protein
VSHVGLAIVYRREGREVLGLRTVPSDGYGLAFDGQLTCAVHPSAVRQVRLAWPQRLRTVTETTIVQ